LKILFRTSGGKTPKEQLGLGHVFRCINLASMFNKKSIFFLIEDFGGVKKLLNERDFENVSVLKKNIDTYSDIKKTIRFVNEKKIDLVIIDRYCLKKNFAKEISSYVKTVIISDLTNIQYEADLVISGFIGYNNQEIKNNKGSKCLLGPKFQILDRRFSTLSKHRNKKYKLLATFGGFDDNNISELFLNSIQNYIDQIKIKIILGPSTKKSKKIKQIEKKYSKQIKIIEETKNMAKEMSDVEYGISSGGLTSYEFASMKIPFGIISQVRHQLKTAKMWEQKGIAINLGLISKKTPKKIDEFLKNIDGNNISLNKIRKQDMDSRGIIRIKREILKLINNSKVSYK
jgi:UDP-2,4-diacetamido-2,4,6-trideoxy-beta-L-altropyranose hydrolase